MSDEALEFIAVCEGVACGYYSGMSGDCSLAVFMAAIAAALFAAIKFSKRKRKEK